MLPTHGWMQTNVITLLQTDKTCQKVLTNSKIKCSVAMACL